mmetsp:Transcript_87030/g.106750  ORF Transcript_87030/g.106750 Transcript_87030/m.106750 type:complete len:189 (-) Transcript_87030:8-574(-)
MNNAQITKKNIKFNAKKTSAQAFKLQVSGTPKISKKDEDILDKKIKFQQNLHGRLISHMNHLHSDILSTNQQLNERHHTANLVYIKEKKLDETEEQKQQARYEALKHIFAADEALENKEESEITADQNEIQVLDQAISSYEKKIGILNHEYNAVVTAIAKQKQTMKKLKKKLGEENQIIADLHNLFAP